ncbi:DUF922 domain-containing protein [Muriicola sp. Z0-33]|uniref:DUF922 domain-containing protein n=1 Tax=Muriicola sp. Z0-33 TaxID=2816957 RepID=UPI002237E231|nr:DUF922 domain-containing protein [Muriicola sp. Z0-33]MCW5517271.1 DUF922 domain-containing protein [Muriicola sp. Z0-33]
MSKYFFIFLFFLVINSWCQEYETIPWDSEQRLSWSDFKAEPSHQGRAAAITASGISYRYSTMESNGEFELDFTVHTYFYPNKSWYHAEVCDEVILSHEQLHFDITELFARKMRRLLTETKFTKNVKAEVRAIYRRINNELAEFQNVYDDETNFSRDREKQSMWNKKIEDALKDNIYIHLNTAKESGG